MKLNANKKSLSPPPVRACVFDMDGLLIDSEDQYTRCTNEILAKYGKGPIPWSVKSKLQGRPGTAAMEIFLEVRVPKSMSSASLQSND
jgi:beta-phosphoglucomutase-like phosphatase (HAD superfamily)